MFRAAKIPSAQKWTAHNAGQHIELGIAENNFFLMLASLGLAAPRSKDDDRPEGLSADNVTTIAAVHSYFASRMACGVSG